MIYLFSSYNATAADGNTRKKNSQCMNNILQNMKATENSYYKILPKTKLII